MRVLFSYLLTLLLFTGCSSQKVRLDSSAFKDNERIVFGKLSDLNKDGRDLKLTYLLSEYDKGGVSNFDNLFPNILIMIRYLAKTSSRFRIQRAFIGRYIF